MAEISSIGSQPSQMGTVQEVDAGKALNRDMRQTEWSDAEQRSAKQRDDERLAMRDLAQMSAEEVDELKENLNQALEPINIKLNFTENEETGDWVVKVMDRDNDEVIRQIPPEAMLKMAERMEEMSGLLIDTWS